MVSSVVAACSESLGMDTGSYVNVLTEAAFLTLKRKCRGSRLRLKPSNVNLSGVEGSALTILGIVTLPIRLSRSCLSFTADFYVVQHFAIHCDGLVGS